MEVRACVHMITFFHICVLTLCDCALLARLPPGRHLLRRLHPPHESLHGGGHVPAAPSNSQNNSAGGPLPQTHISQSTADCHASKRSSNLRARILRNVQCTWLSFLCSVVCDVWQGQRQGVVQATPPVAPLRAEKEEEQEGDKPSRPALSVNEQQEIDKMFCGLDDDFASSLSKDQSAVSVRFYFLCDCAYLLASR